MAADDEPASIRDVLMAILELTRAQVSGGCITLIDLLRSYELVLPEFAMSPAEDSHIYRVLLQCSMEAEENYSGWQRSFLARQWRSPEPQRSRSRKPQQQEQQEQQQQEQQQQQQQQEEEEEEEPPPALIDGTLAVEVTATVQGHRVVVRRRDIDNEEGPDPYFFEADYSVAASTGMLMWEGSWSAIELLRRPAGGEGGEGGEGGDKGGGLGEGDGEGEGGGGDLGVGSAARWLQQLVRGRKVVELGSGIGLLGLCLAAAGGHVLLTDVPSVVECTLGPNVEASGPPHHADPQQLGGWREARRVGPGSAAAQPLDWWKPIEEQRGENDPREAEVVVAAECVWLRELIEPFVKTVLALLRGPQRPRCVLAFRDRSTETSETFSSLKLVVGAFETAGVVAVPKGVCDAPESEGLFTSFYELRLA